MPEDVYTEVQHKLGRGFEVQGFVKPGANSQTLVNTGHGLVSVYPSCRFPTRVSLQSFLRTILSLSVFLVTSHIHLFRLPSLRVLMKYP